MLVESRDFFHILLVPST